jgi:hypothetical protein
LTREAEAAAWIRAHVEPVAKVEVVHRRPWGTVWRVPVAGADVWFKACERSQAFEPRLTATLAARWADRLPDVVAYDDKRAWLLLRDAGEPLGFDRGVEPWLSILPRYAELQRGEAVHVAEHLDGQVPDRRLAEFPALYEAMLARDLPLSGGDSERLRRFQPRLAELCAELAAHAVPETIQHDDLHGANVYPHGGTARILDWGDSCVSHPFLTLFVTFVHIAEIGARPADTGVFRRLRDAYLEPWGRPAELRETFELAYRLGPFAHVFKELRVLDAIPEERRHELGPDLPLLLAHCLEAADR